MRLTKILIFTLTTLMLWGNWGNAQISDGGTPPSFSNKFVLQAQKAPFVASIGFDVNELKAQDIDREAIGLPSRAVKIIPSDISIENSGKWINLADGQSIWLMTIKAPGAVATMLYYNDFYIPEGGKLFIYNKDKSHILGAYTSNTNKKGLEFATQLVAGDELTLEYVASDEVNSLKGPKNQPRINISGIGYGYNNIIIRAKSGGNELQSFGDSQTACQVSVNCPEGDSWQDHKRGVARILVTNGLESWWCSGTLVNNTANDLVPYFLTAFHCITGTTPASLNQTIIDFNYELECTNFGVEPTANTLIGFKLLAESPMSGGSDGALAVLNQAIPESFNVYYNGWDRSSIAATSGVGIHHPAGDVKKIATYNAPPTTTTWVSTEETGATDAFWFLKYIETQSGWSFTEGGSSGSPLFNQNGLVVGTLTGGPSAYKTCATAALSASYYGKLWYHWDQSKKPAQHFKTFLDPLNTGVTSMQGRYANDFVTINYFASKTNIYAAESVTFNNMSSSATTYDWEFEGGTPATSTERSPVVTYNNIGSYKVKLIINKGTANEKEKEIDNYIVVTQKKETCTIYVPIGTGTVTSKFPLGRSDTHIKSLSIYTPEEIGGAGLITSLSWFADNAVSTTSKVIIYMKEVDEDELNDVDNWVTELDKATFVYESGRHWVNNIGWSEIMLRHPFEYSGQKNLKVIVTSKSISTTPELDANWRYTDATNKHKTWILTSTDDPASAIMGTVNNNRPNIRVKITHPCANLKPLKAEFAFSKDILKTENFELGATPIGWTIRSNNSTTTNWEVLPNASLTTNFKQIDPNSTHSLQIIPNTSAFVDSWLISDAVSISNNCMLEFYLNYDIYWVDNSFLTLLISKDAGATWDKLWTTGEAWKRLERKWYDILVDLKEYEGENVQFAWQYYGKGGRYMVLDGIKLTKWNTNKPINIFEGESITPIDISTGAPAIWNWSFEAGNPTSSTLQTPTIEYMEAGSYDISLNVKNGLVESDESKSDIVIVTGRKPVIGLKYNSDLGYTRKANWGSFVPPGHTVNFAFENLTKNVPRTFAWEFDGGTPATSTDKDPKVTYSGETGEYNAKLTAYNPTGSADTTITKILNVGYTTDTIWNIPFNEKGSSRWVGVSPNAGQYLTGTNYTSLSAFAEKFAAPVVPGEITAVEVNIEKITAAVATTEYITVSIYTSLSPSGKKASKQLKVSDINLAGITKVVFDKPVSIGSEFYVVFEDFDAVAPSIVSVSTSTINKNNNTAYVQFKNEWGLYGDKFSIGGGITLNVAPIFTYCTFDIDNTHIVKNNIDNTSDIINVTTNASYWEIIPSANWIQVTKSGNSFTVKCMENKYDARKGFIKVTGGGYTKNVFVEQSSAAPTKLFTQVVGDNANDIQLNWTAPAATPTDVIKSSIFEDVEGHNSFEINSAGSLGWSAIDVDKESTVKMGGGHTFPGMGQPMSYIVLDPSQASFASNTSFAPHSGNKYFAFFNADVTFLSDDWLISPEIDFKTEAKISFWAKAYVNYYPERFAVYYSTTGKDKLDFMHKLNDGPYIQTNNTTWTRYEFVIPADAKYVAINCVSVNSFIFLVDDIYIGNDDNIPQKALQKQQENINVFDNLLVERVINSVDITVNENLQKLGFTSTPINNVVDKKQSGLQSQADDPNTYKILRWDDGFARGKAGLNKTGGTFEAAIKFDIYDLLNYHKGQVKAVEITPLLSANEASYTLVIRQSGKVVLRQPLTNLIVNQVNTIQLTKPITIDAVQELMVGCEITQVEDVFPISHDAKPVIAGKGDLLIIDNTLQMLGIGNWNIAAIVKPSDSNKLYYVYRNGEKIAEASDVQYLDKDLALKGDICYQVSSYQDDIESTLSNVSCTNIKDVLIVKANNVERYYGEANPDVSEMYTITNSLGVNVDPDILTIKPTTSIDNDLYNTTKEVGVYEGAIVASGAVDATGTYRFEYQNGTLTIKGAAVSSISINPNSINMVVGDIEPLTVVVIPDNANVQDVDNWVSSNEKVAKIDANGYVKAIGYGKATITATVIDEGKPYTATCEVKVNTVNGQEVKVSEAFTPNGDGINDYFIIENIEQYFNNELIVFDRNGSVHYNTKGYNNQWDGIANIGKFKGEKLPSGTYYYILKIQGQRDTKGFLVIHY